MKFWINVLISIDQFFNTLAGGNPDCTISGHVGVMSELNQRWDNVKKMIDFTFAPIEQDHCIESWLTDNDNDHSDNFYRVVIISILGCTLLYLPIRIIAYGTR
jgi:hypothetical protein